MLRIAFAAAAAATLFAGSAHAAPAADWSGVYFGLGTGYAWGSTTVTPTTVPPEFAEQPNSTSGPLGTLEFDVNKQMNNTVFGLMGDITLPALNGDSTWIEEDSGGTNGGVPNDWSTSTTVLATLRGRVGHSFGSWLPYISGGLAYRGGNVVWTYENGELPTSSTNTGKFGWTAGAGIEVQLGGSWTLQGEYLFTSFGDVTDSSMPMDDEYPNLFGGTIHDDLSVVRFTLKTKLGG